MLFNNIGRMAYLLIEHTHSNLNRTDLQKI